jgi:polysaccharide export outer membrane protein
MMMSRVLMVLAIMAFVAIPATSQTNPGTGAPGVEVPADYVIGVEDALEITFWKDDTLSSDVVVLPDGKISLTLVNEIQAAGLTTEQLRANIEKAASKILVDPTVGVIVKAINSRRVSICCMVAKPGTYSIIRPTTVFELITIAGGLQEYADEKNIRITRMENGKPTSIRFNYKDFVNGKNLEQNNILLKPGDQITVKD